MAADGAPRVARGLWSATRTVVDELASAVARRPVKVGASPSVEGLSRGRVDELTLELTGIATAGLVVDHVLIRAREVRVVPGLPGRLRADDLSITGTVTERAVNRWLRTDLGPMHVHLRPEGAVVQTRLAGVTVNEVGTELAVEGRWLRLRPVRASVLGVNAPTSSIFRGYLPLPPLPAGAEITGVRHDEGTVAVTLGLGPIDERLDLDLPNRLRRRFRLSPLAEPDRPATA